MSSTASYHFVREFHIYICGYNNGASPHCHWMSALLVLCPQCFYPDGVALRTLIKTGVTEQNLLTPTNIVNESSIQILTVFHKCKIVMARLTGWSWTPGAFRSAEPTLATRCLRAGDRAATDVTDLSLGNDSAHPLPRKPQHNKSTINASVNFCVEAPPRQRCVVADKDSHMSSREAQRRVRVLFSCGLYETMNVTWKKIVFFLSTLSTDRTNQADIK